MIKVMVGVLIGVIAVTVYPNLTDFFVETGMRDQLVELLEGV